MGEDDRTSANEDGCGICRREFLRRTTLAGSDVAVAHRLLNETAVAAANHLPITMPGMAQATMPVRLNINGSDYQWRLEPRTTLLDALRVEKTAHDLDLHDVDSTETFTVAKLLSGGYTRYLASWKGIKPGFGVSALAGFVPRALETLYGSRVNGGFGVFFTIRPAAMPMSMTASGSQHVH